jgi:hypothetical protein
VTDFDEEVWPPGWETEPPPGEHDGEREPDDDDASEPPEDVPEPSLAAFWRARPVLKHIHTFASARMTEPWAVLGAVLARVVAATPPTVQLPKTIGSYASLNMLVGLVGPSGCGKDAARRVAHDAVDVGSPPPFPTLPLGSGEGLSHMFMRPLSARDGGGNEQYRESALVIVGEIDSMTALVQRQASTVQGQLRQAAMGEALGFFYVDPAKRMIVPEHSYRLCLLAGIQPRRSGVLLGDSDGGTPQRFLWMPGDDPDAPDYEPPEPDPLVWRPPDWSKLRGDELSQGMDRKIMPIPDTAVQAIKQAKRDRRRRRADALDGHALLTRLKVAAALAILDGRTGVSEEDWELAGLVMAVSDASRAMCQAELSAESREKNLKQGAAEAERTIMIDERKAEDRTKRAARWIKRRLAEAGSDGMPRTPLRTSLAADLRGDFDPAVDALITSGDVIKKAVTYKGQTGTYYYIANHA